MAILKCKMCGGDIEVSADKTYGTCDSCGSTMTLPKIDSEQRANLYNRANHFRRQNEFDKALAIYEKMISEDDSEAEAHWGAVLCRFGIEYVEDPVSHERIPTCHRASYDSILQDVDYLAALTHSDDYTKSLYEKEATYIAGVQKDIVAISQQEKPYDVFICYKETDAAGNRTKDSALAQDVYYQLTQEGYKVFFSRITLEDKLGQAYEPYIFAALNSAKVMVVIGTKPEYYNAVWVKNEWSRYLNLLKTDKSRLLIPCYRDMDAYELPEELSMLQSQDMGKIGFAQDLIRGIKKVLTTEETPTIKIVESVKVESDTTVNINSLLKRISLFLEDSEWDAALSYCDKVLDLDAECVTAYLYRACATLKCKGVSDLQQQTVLLLQNKDCQKAVRFGDVSLKKQLEDYDKIISARIEENSNAYTYELATTEKNEGGYDDAIELFSEILNYRDSKEQIDECRQLKNKPIYDEAMDAKKRMQYDRAITLLKRVPTYGDSETQIEDCIKLKAILEEQQAKDAAEAAVRAEQQRLQTEKADAVAKARTKKFAIIGAIVVGVLAICVTVYTMVLAPMFAYNDAVALLEQGLYDEAQSAFVELGEYKDSADMAKEAMYIKATDLLEQDSYDGASATFAELGNYKDSADMANEAVYIKATDLLEQNTYDEASVVFAELGDYKDSADMAKETSYCKATDILDEGNYSGACFNFAKLGDYKNSEEMRSKCSDLWVQENANTISVCYDRSIGLKSDGTVVAVGDNSYNQCDVSNWTDIVAVSAGNCHTIGLKSDGTVVAVGDNYYGQCKVSEWTDIVAVSAGFYHTIGLKSDGTVVAVGDNSYNQCDVSNWTDIVAVFAGGYNTKGLKSDGTVVAVGKNDDSQCDVDEWTDIVAVSAGDFHTVGLKSDGTVVAVGDNRRGQCKVSEWTDIVAVSAGVYHTIGLKSDGTVVAVGYNLYDQCKVSEWTDIVAVSAGDFYTVGLKSDGTVVVVGDNHYGQCDVSGWTDIVAVLAGSDHTVGLKSDGTVVAVGDNYDGECEVSGWTDIMIYDK